MNDFFEQGHRGTLPLAPLSTLAFGCNGLTITGLDLCAQRKVPIVLVTDVSNDKYIHLAKALGDLSMKKQGGIIDDQELPAAIQATSNELRCFGTGCTAHIRILLSPCPNVSDSSFRPHNDNHPETNFLREESPTSSMYQIICQGEVSVVDLACKPFSLEVRDKASLQPQPNSKLN